MTIDEIEKSFQSTSEILFGKRLTGFTEYREWLLENVDRTIHRKSEISDGTIYMPDVVFFAAIKRMMVTLDESVALGEKRLSPAEARELTLANASEKLAEIKYVTSDVMVGQNADLRETSTCMNAQHCADGVWYIYTKCDAYCFWPRETEYSFGGHFLFASKFCMKCYNSVALTRCFEVSDSNNSSDCYFCHNVENCQNCMFCFNVKSLRYAIGNVEVGKEKYTEIKKKITNEIGTKLEKYKKLDANIYNLGCWKKK
jgi:hypothetical protein